MSRLINDQDPTPHRKLMNPRIAFRSPLEIEGAFLFILRDRFTHQGTPWLWNEQVNLSKISIELTGHNNTTTADPKPAVWIRRGQIVYGKIVVGDLDQNQPAIMRKRLEHFFSVATCDFTIDCESVRNYESAEIADYVTQFIHKSSNDIQAVFAFRDISGISLGSTEIRKEDENIFNTPVSFRIEFESRWATIPAAPSLKRLTMSITQSGGDTAAFIRNYVLKQSIVPG